MKALPVILSLLMTTGARAGTLAVRILDERGKSTPARVYLTDNAGRPRFPADSLMIPEACNAALESPFKRPARVTIPGS